jgi:hypothetical protein
MLLQCGDDKGVAQATTRVARAATRDRAECGEPPRANAHIGCLFPVLVDHGPLSFIACSPDSFISFPFPELSR